MTHLIEVTPHGLQLTVDGAETALIRQRGGCLDLVYQIRGPQDLETARRSLVGLIDLIVQYDYLKGLQP